MYRLLDWWENVRDFLEMGGPVLLVIGVLSLLMWILIFERIIYFRTGLPSYMSQFTEAQLEYFYDFPAWFFTSLYIGFGIIVILTLAVFPPLWKRKPRQ